MDRIGLVVELTGNQQVMASLREMRRAAEELNSRKFSMKMDTAKLDRQIATTQRALRSLNREKVQLKADGKSLDDVNKKITQVGNHLDDLRKKKSDIQVDARVNTTGLNAANGLLREMERNALSVREVLSGLGTGMMTVGNSLQSLGNAFGGNMLNTIKTTLTAYGTLVATQGLRSSIGRYDTMTTFPRLMQQVGYSAEEAQSTISKLNDAVLGLPTGLDEIVTNAKQYILAMNDMEKGTQLAIAANNAFLANASDASQTAYGMRQIMDILSKGTLRSMEWQSLFTSLGTSIQPIAEYMGFASTEIGTFRSQLQEGAIDAMDFIDALIAVGTGTGELVARVDIQKDTLNATLTNIKNAFSIIGYGVLDELNNLFEDYTGKSLPQNIKGISDALKTNLKPALQGWIQDNGDRIMAFWDRLQTFDWMKLASSIGGAVDNLVTTFAKIVDAVPEEFLTNFITFATVYASPIGKGLTIIGGALRALSGIRLHNLNGDLTTFGKIINGLFGGSGLGKGAFFGAGGAMAGVQALFAAINAYDEKRMREAVEGNTTSSGSGMENRTELRNLLNEAKDRRALLQRQYDALETYEDETGTRHYEQFRANELMNSMTEQDKIIADLEQRYIALSNAEGQVADASGEVIDALEEQADSAQTVKEKFDELRTSIAETIRGQISAFNELKEATKMTSVEMANNADQNAQAVADYLSNLEKAYEFQRQINQEGGYTDAAGNTLTAEAFNRALAEATQGGFADRGMLEGFVQGIEGYSTEDAINYLYEMAEGFDSAELGAAKAADYVAAFQTTAESGEFVTVFGELGVQAGEHFNAGFEGTLRFGEILGHATQQIADALGHTFGTEGIEGTAHFQEEAFNTAFQALDTSGAQEQLNTLTESANGTSEALQATSEAGSEAADGIRMAGTAASSATGVVGALSSVVSGLSSMLGGAASMARELASAINAIPSSKTVTVSVQQTGSVNFGNTNNVVTPMRMATGGKVRPLVDWSPRGTDTVPTILTPGEFISKKKATDKFLPVLERINNMDVTGAFNALWSMLPRPQSFSNVTHNTYNRDNHSTVNQYFNGESQNYSQKKAYKWAAML